MHNLGVIGTDLMGTGIAQVAAETGLQVWLSDIREEALQRAVATIRRGLERLAGVWAVGGRCRDDSYPYSYHNRSAGLRRERPRFGERLGKTVV